MRSGSRGGDQAADRKYEHGSTLSCTDSGQHAYVTAICETTLTSCCRASLLIDRLSLTIGSVSRRASTVRISPDKDGVSSMPASSKDNLLRDAVARGDYGDLRALELPDRHQVDGANSQRVCTAGRRSSSAGLSRSAWQVGQTRFWSARSVGQKFTILDVEAPAEIHPCTRLDPLVARPSRG